MDIKELEFVRDFSDDLCMGIKNLTDLCLALDEIIEEDDETVKKLAILSVWQSKHYFDLLEKVYLEFKDKIDEKYIDQWNASREKKVKESCTPF